MPFLHIHSVQDRQSNRDKSLQKTEANFHTVLWVHTHTGQDFKFGQDVFENKTKIIKNFENLDYFILDSSKLN